VAIEDAIAALPEHWADVTARLGERDRQELYGLIGGLSGPDHNRVVSRLADLLVEGLPASHPVRRALVAGDLFAPATVDWPAVGQVLRRQAELALSAADPSDEAAARGQVTVSVTPPGAGRPGTSRIAAARPGEEIVRSVAARLLLAPALTQSEVRQRGADPADPGLIRLTRPDGGQQWPAFQFGPAAGPWPVIRAVNDLLDAAADPLAAADWWLSDNSWLGAAPSALLGQVPDDYLVRAAAVVGSEV
jgi:hypothetical protein